MKIWDKIVGDGGSTRLADRARARSARCSALGRRRRADDGAHPGLAPDRLHHRRDRARRQDGAASTARCRDDEVEAFRYFFQVPPGEEKNVERFFDLAKRDVAGFETYARQVAALFPDAPEILGERARGPVRHRQGRRPGRRRGSRLSRQGRAPLRPRAARASSAPRPRRWASSSASPASSWASIRWRPTSRSARPGCARCAPTIPTG